MSNLFAIQLVGGGNEKLFLCVLTNFKYDGGINEYVKFLNEGKNIIHNNPIFFSSKKNNVTVECS